MLRLFRRQLETAFILWIAYAIALHALSARTFHGDELNSIAEAANLGQNPNGIFFFVFMHFWQLLGLTEFWLRVPAVFFAIAATAINYRLGVVLIQPRSGFFLGLLLATAPFVLEYAQQNRFYTFFLFTASGVYLSFALYLKKSSNKNLALLIFFNILVVGAHFFGLLIVLTELIWVFLFTQKVSPRIKWLLFLAASLFFLALLFGTPSQNFFYNVVARWTNPYGDPLYTGARGVSVAQLAKIPVTLFFFGFGESVYPLDLSIVGPGLLIFLSVAIIGVLRNFQSLLRLKIWLVPLLLMPVMLYLIFDPLSPPTLQGAGPRYLIFLIPFFYLVIVACLQGQKTLPLLVAMLMVNLVGLWSFWYGDWIYTDDRVNWREIAGWASDYVSSDTRILLDGPSSPLASYYFPSSWSRSSLQSDTTIDTQHLVAISYNWHAGARLDSTRALRTLQMRYEPSAVLAYYPFFGYVLDRKPTPGAYTVRVNGQVDIPNEIYGIEFQDLRLPFSVRYDQSTFDIIGAFGLPRFDGTNVETIPLTQPTHARKIILLSHLIDADNIQTNTVVANLKLIGEDGQTRVLPLRVGHETSAWDGACTCGVAYQWRKRAALVGLQAYPSAWHEFDATIFSAGLNLDSSMTITALEFDRGPAPGKFYVWGIVVKP